MSITYGNTTNRRRFLALLGVGVLTPSAILAGEPGRKRSRWDLLFSNHDTSNPQFVPDPSTWRDDELTAAWLGHATVLINFYGSWIITDPVFSTRVGVRVAGMTIGPKRLVYPAIPVDKVPKPDLILLSHAHMDHMDLASLEKFDPDTPVLTAANTADVLDGLPFRRVSELDWWGKTHVGEMEIEALRVKHFGWRWPWEKDRSRGYNNGRSFNAYRITKNGRSIVFGGDTAHHDFYKDVGRRVSNVELAIMPIGAYDPWIRNHCNPEQAVDMAGQLGAEAVLPIHWGTFIQSDEARYEPIRRFTAAMKNKNLTVALTAIGETWTRGSHRKSPPSTMRAVVPADAKPAR